MKFVIILGLALALANALSLPSNEIKSDNMVVSAAGPEGRITRGKKARASNFRYTVGLSIKSKMFQDSWCEGVLISNTHVLTAAHCVEFAVKVKVLLGSTRREEGQVAYEILPKDIVRHEHYNRHTVKNDIALIRIPFTSFDKYIQAVKMPKKGNAYPSYARQSAIAVGWGRISDHHTDYHEDLQYAYVKIISNEECGKSLPLITSTNICTSGDKKISVCEGDSGGPLVVSTSQTLVGITSFVSKHDCEKKYSAAFTRITSYLDWIEENSK